MRKSKRKTQRILANPKMYLAVKALKTAYKIHKMSKDRKM
jgi:hypothetical protein